MCISNNIDLDSWLNEKLTQSILWAIDRDVALSGRARNDIVTILRGDRASGKSSALRSA